MLKPWELVPWHKRPLLAAPSWSASNHLPWPTSVNIDGVRDLRLPLAVTTQHSAVDPVDISENLLFVAETTG